MNKRPKSREETPKEGSDSARRYRTATICDRAAQSARGFETFSAQKWQTVQVGNMQNTLIRSTPCVIHEVDFRPALNFVIVPVTRNAPLMMAESCMQNANHETPDWRARA
jgi:hypothetical protein